MSEFRYRFSILWLLAVVISVVTSAHAAQTLEQPVTPTQPAANRHSDQLPTKEQDAGISSDLKVLEHNFLAIIKKGDVGSLQTYISPDGVFLGIDSDRSSRASILAELRKKQGLYCLLFDSECLYREVNVARNRSRSQSFQARWCSYKEFLTEGSGKVSTTRHHYKDRDQAEIIVTATDYKCNLPNNMLDFVFTRQRGQWKLTAVPHS